MSVSYFGDFAEDATVRIPFNTFSSDDPQASVTITNLADADIMVHKDGGTTQIATDGATIAIDYDGITGNHLITVDSSAHADYSIGSDYMVRIEGTTVDGGTINAWVGFFSIENRSSSLNATALAALEDQYDGTGLIGGTYPANQDQLGGIANVGSAVHRPAASYTLTTGTQSANTYTATEALDETRHEHTDDAGAMELYYEFNIGSGTPSSTQVTGYVTGNNDDLDVYGYDWVAAAWVQIGNIQGAGVAVNLVRSYDLFVDMVGTGANIGTVRIRFYKASGLTSATLAVDQIFIAFSQGESGYVDGIEVDTNASNTGTIPGIDGIKGNPVSTWAAALTLSASTGIKEFKIINGSAVTLSANSDNYTIGGQSYTLALNSQSIASIYVFGADITGTGTGAGIVFEDCPIGNVSLPPCVMRHCFPYGTITNTGTGDWFINDPRSRVAGSAAVVFDFGTAIGNTNLNIRADSGGWQLESMGDTGTDVASLEGWGQLIEGTCTGGNVNIRGNFPVSGITNLTLVDTARFESTQLVDDIWDEVISKSAHNVGQSAAKILRQGGDLVQIDGAVSDVSPTITGFDTNLTQADDFFNDAVMIFSNGAANAGIGKPVVTYLNTDGAVTFISPDEWPVTPVNGDDFVIYANHVHPVTQIQSGLATEAKQDAQDLIITEARLAELDAANIPADIADVPTVAEFEARTPTAAQLAYIVANSATGVPVTITTAGGSTTAAVLNLVDGAASSSTDEQYNSRLLVFNNGTLKDVVTDITDYNGTTKVATITAIPTAPTSSHTARLI